MVLNFIRWFRGWINGLKGDMYAGSKPWLLWLLVGNLISLLLVRLWDILCLLSGNFLGLWLSCTSQKRATTVGAYLSFVILSFPSSNWDLLLCFSSNLIVFESYESCHLREIASALGGHGRFLWLTELSLLASHCCWNLISVETVRGMV